MKCCSCAVAVGVAGGVAVSNDDAVGAEDEAITELLEVDFGLVEGDVLPLNGHIAAKSTEADNLSID